LCQYVEAKRGINSLRRSLLQCLIEKDLLLLLFVQCKDDAWIGVVVSDVVGCCV